ncbi:MAG: quercetin dioxygenase-like cupin family protein, partial [Candidatus Paceibacteria bacterium]
MQPSERYRIECAELVLPSAQLNHDLEFFCGLGFTIDLIYPADSPELYVLQGHGLRIRLESGLEQSDARLRLTIPAGEGAPQNCVAPNGTRVEFVAIDATEALAPLCSTLSICRDSDQAWGTGRAGMQYRDLIPDRAGGHFIASHIRILEGGLVPDYVHYHRVDVQIIYCLKGWVKVVYEDQGEPFVLCEGDCISQPPLIRHRVLECSPGLEVLEIGSPARHETRSDPALNLPNQSFRPQRE